MQDETWSFARDVSTVNGYAFSGDTLFLEISFVKEKRKPRVVIEFFTDKAHPDPTLRKVFWSRSTRNGYPISKQAIEWLSPLPDRVLSLEASTEGNITVRLTEPDKALDKYATLSHRWSLDHNFITTIENIGNRKEGILWEELPKTFQDAARFCLELNISYLWIDALCIIQDDPMDWELQSAKMADIYHQSCLTLAATWSNSNSTGCFPAQADEYAEHSLEVTNSAQDNFSLKVRPWVFQERVLSPRVLHFCLREMIWECCEHTICECGGESESSSREDAWHGLVEHYSKLKLTKQTDRLPALSGLAHRMAPFLGDYHAGLWKSSLFLDLAWAADKPSSHLNRSREYIGPSWSWVSTHVLKAKGKNYYGEVSSATLVVSGLLRSATLGFLKRLRAKYRP
ncbi:heterokaryon incompatibility protein (HET) domain-containing protein [Trichoderma breve]|uniref:Heterokaryon incompatibility protein (HET) domain-containing protein n=1 Tax=Trichoderma breve TaxID=2034170 RepID=A0A9W9B2A0_9HYPO|nr:heterokaryon incompatibility protein (HET) domain-containing protein [Trichoderma breve]KAJ4854217.1 heterokaryon incompatibility protein (HET) domain-containing protein [Trichoderma breve]